MYGVGEPEAEWERVRRVRRIASTSRGARMRADPGARRGPGGGVESSARRLVA